MVPEPPYENHVWTGTGPTYLLGVDDEHHDHTRESVISFDTFSSGVATDDLPGHRCSDPLVFHELFVALFVQFSDWK